MSKECIHFLGHSVYTYIYIYICNDIIKKICAVGVELLDAAGRTNRQTLRK